MACFLFLALCPLDLRFEAHRFRPVPYSPQYRRGFPASTSLLPVDPSTSPPSLPRFHSPSPSLGTVDRSVLLRLAVALLAGALIGLERRAASATAGVRTLVLVSLGSAIFTLVAVLALTPGGGDPTRIAASIAAGVGFVGSGTITATESAKRGLTTAASIWIAAALGVTAAYGLLGTALMGAVMTVVILRWSKWERYFRRKFWRWERMREVAIKRKRLQEIRRSNAGVGVDAELQWRRSLGEDDVFGEGSKPTDGNISSRPVNGEYPRR